MLRQGLIDVQAQLLALFGLIAGAVVVFVDLIQRQDDTLDRLEDLLVVRSRSVPTSDSNACSARSVAANSDSGKNSGLV